MTEMKVYRWASALVPGTVVASGIALMMYSWDELDGVSAEVFGATLILWLIGAYIIGIMLWGIGYWLKCWHLRPFLQHTFDGEPTRRYETLRLLHARRAPGAANLTEVDFRSCLFAAIEKLQGGVGARLSAEWEFVGLLQALAVGCLVLGFVGIWGLVDNSAQSEAILSAGFRPLWVIVWSLVGWFATGLAYRYRVQAFGRDVGFAVQLMNEMGTKTKQKPIFALDFDGVIADTNTVKAGWIKQKYGIALSPAWCDHTNCVAVIGAEGYSELSRHAYSENVTRTLAPVPGAVHGIHALSQLGSIVLISARTGDRLRYAKDWLADKGLRQSVATIHEVKEESKAIAARRLGACILVDDDVRHLIGHGGAGMKCIRFASDLQVSHCLDLGIYHARDWEALVELVQAG